MESDRSQLSDGIAELAALADGPMPPHRRARALAEIEPSPELSALLEQPRTVGAIRQWDRGANSPTLEQKRL